MTRSDLATAPRFDLGALAGFDVGGLMTTDTLGLISDVNSAMCALTGVSREQMIGTPLMGYFCDPTKAKDAIRQVLADGSIADYEMEVCSAGGQATWVSYAASTFRSADGKLEGVIASARDISGQKHLENELRQAQHYTRGLIEASFDALLTVDPGLRIIDVNEQTARITGYSRDQLIGSYFSDYFTDPERASAGVAKALAETYITDYLLTLRPKRPGAPEKLLSFNASVFKDAQGDVRGIFAAGRDITQQALLEEELRQSKNYTRGLIESNIDALMTTDTLGIITDANKQMCEVTGCTMEQLIGTPFKDYFTDPKRAEDAIRRVLSDDRVTNYELTLRGPEGRELLVSYNATTFMGADGKLRGVFASARDITEQKRLQEQLQRKNEQLEEQNRRVQEATRLKSEFLANMSHELRTPLNGIIGFSELMHDGKVGPVSADHKEYLGDILTSSRHLQQLINDVLDLAKVESGKMEFRAELVDLGKVIGEVRDIMRTLTAEKRIHLSCEVDPALGKVVIDPAKLKQVLYNYLSNAIKFTPDAGKVTVRARAEASVSFRLEVEDSGIGIRSEDFPRLFVEFQQLDASSAKRYQGTGLGLALTRRIVEAQGGQVGVVSTVGRGSTFFAVLPRQAAQDDSSGAEVPLHREPGQLAVLVVEDDRNERAWVMETLVSAGYAVEAAATGEAAVRAAQRTSFDAVTLDLLLPDMSGWDVLRALRGSGHSHDLPAIVLTVVAERGNGLGFLIQDFLNKPVQPAELHRALERVGLLPGQHSLLVIDDDPNTAKLVSIALQDTEFQVQTAVDGTAGLLAITKHPPSVVVLDLLMQGMDGFEFLYQFRLTDLGRRTPVIVLTDKDLTSAERTRLQASAQAVVLKGSGSSEALIRELEFNLARSHRNTSGG